MGGSLGEKLLFVAVIVGFIMLFSLMRGRNPRKERAEIVRTLLSELRINIILVDTFDRQPKPRNLEVTGWLLHKKKVGFLGKELQKDLSDAFTMAVDYNRRLKAARKARSDEKVTLDLEAMQPAHSRIKKGLEDWLLANVGNIDQKERPGMLDGLFGRW